MAGNLVSRTRTGSSVVYLILDIFDLLHDGRHGCASEGRGFEDGKARRLLARSALFVRAQGEGGRRRGWEMEKGRIEKRGEGLGLGAPKAGLGPVYSEWVGPLDVSTL